MVRLVRPQLRQPSRTQPGTQFEGSRLPDIWPYSPRHQISTSRAASREPAYQSAYRRPSISSVRLLACANGATAGSFSTMNSKGSSDRAARAVRKKAGGSGDGARQNARRSVAKNKAAVPCKLQFKSSSCPWLAFETRTPFNPLNLQIAGCFVQTPFWKGFREAS